MSGSNVLMIKLSSYINAYRAARRNVSNWPKLLFYALLRKEGEFSIRGGSKIKYNARQLLKILASQRRLIGFKLYDVNGELVRGEFFGFSFCFPIYMIGYVTLVGEHFYKVYDVDVRDAVVLDIGAYLGDSVLYWLYKGAKKVIAVEPVPEHFKVLQLNCSGLPVETILGSVGSRVPKLNMIGSQRYGVWKTQNVNRFLDVPLLSLIELTEKYKPDVVKLNCEGCEHFLVDDLILTPKLGVKKLIVQIHRMYDGWRDTHIKLENNFGKGKITSSNYKHITVIWEFTESESSTQQYYSL